MVVQEVEVWKHKIICLLQDCEKGQRYLIDRDLITIVELNVFSHFIYNFGKTLLDHSEMLRVEPVKNQRETSMVLGSVEYSSKDVKCLDHFLFANIPKLNFVRVAHNFDK